jgi:CheY-like chemotaxis protein
MPRILVIDDEEVLRKIVRVVLEVAGYEVLEAVNGAAGLRREREQGADLVLVDIFMPEMDGLEVIRRLRADSPQTRIIAMSGGGKSGQMDMLTAAAALGASRTLRKPFEPRELLAVVGDVLEQP